MNKFYSPEKEISFVLSTTNGSQQVLAQKITAPSAALTRFFILVLAFLVLSTASKAQNASATWALTASPGSAAVSGNIAATAISFGNGTSNSAYSATNGASARSMNGTSQTSNDYFQFTISPSAYYSLNITSIASTNLVSAVAATNNARFLIQYSYSSGFSSPVNVGTTVTPTTSAATTTNGSLNIAVASGQTLYVRIFAWGLSASATDFFTKDFKILGTACPSTASISYPNASYCKTASTTATATRTGLSGGTFTASPSGLVINSSTGLVDVTNSTAGSYTVSYTVAGGTGCGNLVATATIKINDLPTAFTFTGPGGATAQFCSDGSPATFTLSGSQTGVTYTFTSINPGGNTPPGQSFDVAGVGGTMNFVKTPQGNWSYEVIATDNTTGCTNTMNGEITAVTGASVTSQPATSVSLCSGATQALTVNLSNAASLAWQLSTDGGSSWTTVASSSPYNITKASNNSTTTLTISNVTTAMNNYIYRVAGGSASPCSTVYSNGTTLSVSAIPVITTQPASKSLCNNSTLTLSVVASYATSYQWYKNGATLSNGTSATYTTTFNSATGTGQYYVVATGPCGSLRSSDANITATSNPSSTTWQGPTTGSTPATATAWEVDANWSCGVPTKTTDAVIPANIVDGYPTLKSGLTGAVRDLSIVGGSFGAFLTVEGKLQVYGTVSNSGGTFTASNGTIEFAGSTSQTIAANLFNGNAVQNLVISNNVNLGGSLDLTGALSFGSVNSKTFATNGYLTLKSSVAATARVADLTNAGANSGNSITGSVTVERYVPTWDTRKYRLLTAPVLGTTINASWQEGQTYDGANQYNSGTATVAAAPSGYGTLITGQQQGTAANANPKGLDFWGAISNSSGSVRSYVSAPAGVGGTWQPLASTLTANAFDQNQAYLLFVRGDRSVSTGTAPASTTLRAKGVLKQGSYSVSVPEAKGYTLIGNPYASPLDFQAVYNANPGSIQNYFWMWQSNYGNSTGGYLLLLPSGDGSSYECIPGNFTASASNRLISSGQGFLVTPKNQDNNSSTVNTVTIGEAHKSGNTPGVAVFRQYGAPPAKLYINLNTSNASGQAVLLDGSLLKFNEVYADGRDNVVKSVNGSENLAVLKNNTDLIVNALDVPKAGDTVQLKLWNTGLRNYRFEIKAKNFAPLGLTAVLCDKFAKTETPLPLGEEVAVFNFSVAQDAASKDALRFFIVFKAASTLPLQLSSASAAVKGKGVEVKWTLADEGGVKGYVVEKSAEGTVFATLTETKAVAGSGPAVYTAFDEMPFSVGYYRVKMTGMNGEAKYSPVMKVQLQKTGESVAVFPNPVSGGVINLQLTNKPAGTYRLSLFNAGGQRVWAQAFQHNGGSASASLFIGTKLPAGVYSLNVGLSQEESETIRVQVVQ